VAEDVGHEEVKVRENKPNKLGLMKKVNYG
jgi:hypothetical protein